MATENDSSTSSAHLGEAGASNQVGGPIVDQVFSLFKDYLQNQLETKTKEIEQRSKIDKEVVRLKYRSKQKQFELNAAIDSIWRTLKQKPNKVDPATTVYEVSPRTQGNFCERGKNLSRLLIKAKMAGRSSPSMNPMSWLQVQRTRSVSKKLVSRPVVNAVKKTKQTLSTGKRRDLVGR